VLPRGLELKKEPPQVFALEKHVMIKNLPNYWLKLIVGISWSLYDHLHHHKGGRKRHHSMNNKKKCQVAMLDGP
jgi:hypothetical protein